AQHLLVLLVDTTERKSAQESLQSANGRLSAMFEGARDAILLADPETGPIVDANAEAGRFLNLPKHDIVGRHQSQLHPAEESQKYRRLFGELGSQPRAVRVEGEVVTSDGRRRPVEISTSRIGLPDGRQLVQGIFR